MNVSISFNPGLIVDLVLLAIILWKLISGIRNGAVRMLGGLVSLGCGIYAGSLLRSLFAESVAQRWLLPAIRRILDTAMNKLGLTDILENLTGILENTGLPGFLKLGIFEEAAERMRSTGTTALSNAADLIAQRLAGAILFLLGLLLVSLLVRILFNGVVDPLISGLPVLNEANKLLGALLGAAMGILLAGLLLALCYRLLPVFSEQAWQLFGEDSIQHSFIMKQYFRLFPGAFKG